MLRWGVVYLLMWFVAAVAWGCDEYGQLPSVSPTLMRARMASEGVERLEVPRLSAESVDRILDYLLSRKDAGRLNPAVHDGRVSLAPELRELENFLNEAITSAREKLEALPGNHSHASARADIRWSREGWVHGTSDRGHVDGGYATLAVTLEGPTTIVSIGSENIPAPLGVPVLMTGQEGARAWNLPGTYHAAPPLGHKPRRLFIQIVF